MRSLRSVEILLSLALLIVFLGFRDLPLVDLPQHVLQIANWQRIDAHDPALANFELNFQTPYWFCYPVVRLLAEVVPILVALKLALWATITAQAITLRVLCVRLGHDAWLGLLGYALGLGFGFCFGFVSFCTALPLVYLAIVAALNHRGQPGWRSGLLLGGLLAALLVAHGVALAFSMAVLGPLLLFGDGKPWERGLPLLAPVVLGMIWLGPGGAARLGGDLWQIEANRLLELPAQLVGIGSSDPRATLLGCLLLLTLAGSVGAPLGWRRLLPLGVVLLGYAFFPTLFRGTGLLQPRFSAYVVPALLLACAPREVVRPALRATTRTLSLLLPCTVIALFAYRLRGFNQETADFHALAERLPSGLSIRPLLFEPGSRTFPGTPAHLHVPAYYSAQKGGRPGYSFAMYSTAVVRLRAGVPSTMRNGEEWRPEEFQAEREADDYDYFIVKSTVDRTQTLFAGPHPRAVLDRHIGDWWGYRHVSRAQAARF